MLFFFCVFVYIVVVEIRDVVIDLFEEVFFCFNGWVVYKIVNRVKVVKFKNLDSIKGIEFWIWCWFL